MKEDRCGSVGAAHSGEGTHRWFRIVNRILPCLLCLVLGVLACATGDAGGCQSPGLSRRDLIKIVEAEVRNRGGEPIPGRKTRIKVRRAGCDYVYREISIPKRPGGFLVVRINQFGDVTEFLPGL